VSFRQLPETREEAVKLLREIMHRIEALEGGGALRGQVSFDPVIQIGDVLISVIDGVGTHRTVEFKNVLSGSTSTISLP
jgi:hypothetical protein